MAEYDDIMTLEAHLRIMLEKVEAIRKKITAPEKKPRKATKKELQDRDFQTRWAKRKAMQIKRALGNQSSL